MNAIRDSLTCGILLLLQGWKRKQNNLKRSCLGGSGFNLVSRQQRSLDLPLVSAASPRESTSRAAHFTRTHTLTVLYTHTQTLAHSTVNEHWDYLMHKWLSPLSTAVSFNWVSHPNLSLCSWSHPRNVHVEPLNKTTNHPSSQPQDTQITHIHSSFSY